MSGPTSRQRTAILILGMIAAGTTSFPNDSPKFTRSMVAFMGGLL